jgi:hypothetical protein
VNFDFFSFGCPFQTCIGKEDIGLVFSTGLPCYRMMKYVILYLTKQIRHPNERVGIRIRLPERLEKPTSASTG